MKTFICAGGHIFSSDSRETVNIIPHSDTQQNTSAAREYSSERAYSLQVQKLYVIVDGTFTVHTVYRHSYTPRIHKVLKHKPGHSLYVMHIEEQ